MTSARRTEIDPRFSDPGAQVTAWDAAVAVLESAQLAWLTTVRADGRPHVTPLVAVWYHDACYFAAGPNEQKTVNLRRDAHVALTTGCNSWEHGLDVVVEGTASRVLDPAVLERLAAEWAAKWDGRWRYVVDHEGFRHESGDHGAVHVFEVRPDKVLAFGKGTFSQTRHLPN